MPDLTTRIRNRINFASKEGFTVMELVVVTVIIGILASIAVASFLGQVSNAQDASSRTYLTNAYKVSIAENLLAGGTGYPEREELATSLSSQIRPATVINDVDETNGDSLGVIISDGETLVLSYRGGNNQVWVLATDPLNGLRVTKADDYVPPPIIP